MPRTCARHGCAQPLPVDAATQRRYCSVRCQVAAWRARHCRSSAKLVAAMGVTLAVITTVGCVPAKPTYSNPYSAPYPAQAAPTPVGFGQPWVWGDKVTAMVSRPATYRPTGMGTSRNADARHLRTDVTVTNGATTAFPIGMWQVSATADGAAVEKVFDYVNGVVSSSPPNTIVQPGRSVTFPVIWALPSNAPMELQIQIQPAYLGAGMPVAPAVVIGQG